MSSDQQLQRTLAELLASQPNDQRLRDHLEGLVNDPQFAGLTWFWGPRLYQRNRVIFRSLIVNHFSTVQFTKVRFKNIRWSQHAELQTWLDQARANRDTQLVRRLMRWKYRSADGWSLDQQAWTRALVSDYRSAATPAARAVVLDEYDDYFELEEASAVQLYEADRRCNQFIVRHLPRAWWGPEKRKLWQRLAALAQQASDNELLDELVRRQLPMKEWSEQALQLANQVLDPTSLCEQLERRHPLGYGLKVNDTLLRLLERRGRDVIPYVRTKLNNLASGWITNSTQPFVDLAEKNGWWDLWSVAIRGCRDAKLFNTAVDKLLKDYSISDEERVRRLEALTGVSREWNWSGFGLAQIHALEDHIAVNLYARYPKLLRGPYQAHVMATLWQVYSELLKAALRAEDHELVDALASRYVTRGSSEYVWSPPSLKAALSIADGLCTYYDALRTQDASEYALRAANVLTRVPAFAINNINSLLKSNSLARLLLVRSFEDYLSQPTAVRNLVEASDIHVQMLAYRILAQDDDRARAMAVQSLDILIGTLLRPLHRRTRLAAFDALLNAARADADCAQLVLSRARDATKLPDRKYPKEELIGLIGRILHHSPQLRSAREQPVVYGLTEAAL